VFKPFGEENAVYTGEFDDDDISAWVKGEAFPLLGEIGPDNYQKYLERGQTLVWFFLEKDTSATADVKTAATQVAKDFKTKFSFVWLDGIRWADHAKNFGVKWKPPGIVIEDRTKNKNFVFPEGAAVTADSLRAHLQGYLDGSLAPTVKSQEIPTENDGPVKVVVGKSFDAVVLDDSKDVLVEFYAPWCGHCKTLAPKYEELGKMFASEPSIVIAKVDATENDTPAQIKGFPTLIFYGAGAKDKPVTYSGERTEDAMAKFLRENAVTLKGKAGSGSGSSAGHEGHDHDHDEL
jgi:protein disulfide-isomerase A1